MHGFFNLDLRYPLVCLTDGVELYQALYETYMQYRPDRSYAIYQNLYDVSLPIKYDCNPFYSGGIQVLTLYLLTPIIRFYLAQTRQFNLLIPLYAYIAIQ